MTYHKGMSHYFKLTRVQEDVLKKVTSSPQTKDQIGASGGTLRALVKKRYIKSRNMMDYENAVVFWK